MIFRKDKGKVIFDERDRLIKERAKLAGFTAAFLFAGLACMIPFFILGPDRAISVIWLPNIWGGTFLIVLFGLVQVVIFGWVFGMGRGWKELHTGADIRIPRIYRFIIKFVTPTYIAILLAVWFVQKFWSVITMADYDAEHRPYILVLRLVLLSLFCGLCFMIHYAWRRRGRTGFQPVNQTGTNTM